MNPDPVLTWTFRLVLVFVLVRGLAGKLGSPRTFASAIRGYALLPDGLTGIAAAGLLAAELALVPALLWPETARTASLGAAGLLLLYASAISLNLARGRRDIDCGCGGPSVRQTLHPLLVQRNLVYVAFGVVASLPVAARELSWLDGLSAAAATATLVALALAVDALAAVASRPGPAAVPRVRSPS